MSENGESNVDTVIAEAKPKVSRWRFISKLFEGLHWLTERLIGLLRSFVTAAMFLVVAFVIYNAWESRNTVAVKPFQVPVSMGKHNHEQAGRIIANLLNRHLLDAQNTLQSQLNRDGVNLNHPVAAEQQVLIEGESIKLPETGITIDNVIEFISGIFGRKNLNGSVYYEADLQDFTKTKLHLQITLRGRIISFSEDDLGEKQRALLPMTRPNGLNIQLISAMLKARSKEILSIASVDHNLHYYCTRETGVVEHDVVDYEKFFDYCRELQSADVTPKSLQLLQAKLEGHGKTYDKSIVGSVLVYLKDESYKRQATLCQSKANQSNAACKGVKVADARSFTRTVEAAASPVSINSAGSGLSNIQAVENVVYLDSVRAIEQECQYLHTRPASATAGVVSRLENQCFAESPVQQAAQQTLTMIASPEATLQANQAEGDATQLLHNGLYTEALAKYQEAITLNCNNAVAWANMGILLSTADKESDVPDLRQAQCALYRATTLNNNAGWMRHSLCVVQAKRAEGDLERFLSYESCQQARQLEPINDALYDKLFYLDIGDRYRELEEYEKARDAYVQAMSNEKSRNCKTNVALQSLVELGEKGVTDAPRLACAIYKKTEATVVEEDATRSDCEVELNKLMEKQDCV